MKKPLNIEYNYTSRLLDAVDSLIVVFDLDDKIVGFNQACEELTGYTFEEVKEHPVQEMFRSHDETHFGSSCYKKLINLNRPKNYSNHWRTRDGNNRLIAWSNQPLKDDEGNITHVIATGTDITEQDPGKEHNLLSSEHQEILNNLIYISLDETPLTEKLNSALKSMLAVSWLNSNVTGAIFLLEEDSNTIKLEAEQNMTTHTRRECTRIAFDYCLSRQFAQNGRIQFSSGKDHEYITDSKVSHCHYSVPIKSSDNILGVLVLYLEDGHIQDIREIVFLRTVANILTTLIERYFAQKAFTESQENLANAQRIAQLGSWEWNRISKKLYCSKEARQILRLDPDIKIINHQTFISRVHSGDKHSVLKTLHTALKHGESFNLQHRITCDSGSERVVVLKGEVELDQSGKLTRIIGAIQDMTERLLADQELQLVASVFDGAQESIMVTDIDNKILRVNKAFSSVTGYSEDEVIGKDAYMMSLDLHNEDIYSDMWSKVRNDGIWRGEIWSRRKNGQTYPELRTTSAVRNERGEIIRFISISMDISDKKESEKRIYRLAHYDELTQLPNRIMFIQIVSGEIVKAQKNGQQLGVLSIGIDGLKRINDCMGYSTGDRLLKIMADRLQHCIRKNDTLSKWAGDEFIILLTNLEQVEDAVRITRKILEHIIEPISLEGQERLVVTASIGTSLYPDKDTAVPLIQKACVAMYKAKQNDGNNCQFYTEEMNVAVIERLNIENELRNALELNQFELHYQPLMDMNSRRIIGAEALLRWHNPVRGLVPPDKFIPITEDSGLIIPIGTWVLNQACVQCEKWHQSGLSDLKISVNISARQFRNCNLVKIVNDALLTSGLKPSCLTLELTESSTMDNAKETIESLHMLKDLGVSLSIDDFGTGYSSLAYLKQFPIDTLKIDRSFVQDIDMDTDDRSIVESIIAMGHSMNLAIVAEGVEKIEHLNFLNEQHCDVAQGYFISKPMPADEFLEFSKQWILEEQSKEYKHAG